MIGNYYTLRAVADSLSKILPGRVLGWILSQERDELIVGFENFESTLVISCRTGETTCFLQPRFSRARRNSVELMPECRRRVIERVWMPPGDRILLLECRDGLRLVLQLYAPHANVMLTDPEGTILDTFKRARELRGRVLELRSAPPGGDHHSLSRHLREHSRSPLAIALKTWMPEMGPDLTRELLFRAHRDGTELAKDLDGTQITLLEREREILRAELRTPRPCIYADSRKGALFFSLTPLQHMRGLEAREFDDLHEALRSTVYRRRSATVFLDEKKELQRRLRHVGERASRSLQAFRHDQTRASRAEGYHRFGELLLTHLHEVPAGATQVELPHTMGPQRIPLDPALSIPRNAQRYFERARASRRALEEAPQRGAMLERRLALATELFAAVDACHDRNHLEDLMRARRTDVDALGLRFKEDEKTEIPFRVFVVEGGFEVWAGKNSANNDLLTLRYARPKDLWFHARGSGGSHVILRADSAPGEPGKRAREQAAAIAAYYSKMRKASVVPVTVTEKKYVRKPRGAPAGTVAVERESVLFAAPALPKPSPRT